MIIYGQQSYPFPLPVDRDWVRIQCGTDGEPNFIFGLTGLREFYQAGAGIYCRDAQGKLLHSLAWWQAWYQDSITQRITNNRLIKEIKELAQKQSLTAL